MNHGLKALKRGASHRKSFTLRSCCLARGVLKGREGESLAVYGAVTGLLITDLAAAAGGHKKQQHPGFKGEPKTPVGVA